MSKKINRLLSRFVDGPFNGIHTARKVVMIDRDLLIKTAKGFMFFPEYERFPKNPHNYYRLRTVIYGLIQFGEITQAEGDAYLSAVEKRRQKDEKERKVRNVFEEANRLGYECVLRKSY
jgi:hypothetical protein